MKRSDSIKEIASALAKAQIKFKPVKLDRTNPYYNSKYATLTSLVESVAPALNENGISVWQPVEDGPGVAKQVTTLLAHSSGEWIESTLTLILQRQDMQGLGSATTYARRYALAAMVGAVTEEDDDGNSASQASGGGGAYRANDVGPGRPPPVPINKSPMTRASPENMGLNLPVSFLKEHAELLDWILPIGEGVKGKKLRDIPLERLKGGYEQLVSLKELGKIEEVTKDQIGKLLKLISEVK
jgi:hypothetical protein